MPVRVVRVLPLLTVVAGGQRALALENLVPSGSSWPCTGALDPDPPSGGIDAGSPGTGSGGRVRSAAAIADVARATSGPASRLRAPRRARRRALSAVHPRRTVEHRAPCSLCSAGRRAVAAETGPGLTTRVLARVATTVTRPRAARSRVCAERSRSVFGKAAAFRRELSEKMFLEWCDRGGDQLADLPSEGPTMCTGL